MRPAVVRYAGNRIPRAIGGKGREQHGTEMVDCNIYTNGRKSRQLMQQDKGVGSATTGLYRMSAVIHASCFMLHWQIGQMAAATVAWGLQWGMGKEKSSFGVLCSW